MALLFLDSFDHDASTIKWTDRLTVLLSDEGLPGRTNLASTCDQSWVFPGQYAWRRWPCVFQTVTAGAAVKLGSMSYFHMSLTNPIGYYSAGPMFKAAVEGTGDGRLYASAMFGSSGWYSTGHVSFPCITQGEWYYIELYARPWEVLALNKYIAYVDVKVRVNEEVVIDETISGPSRTSGPNFSEGQMGFTSLTVRFGPYGMIDDVYITDGEMLGDIRVNTFRPNGPGDLSEWTAVGASTLWEAVRNPGFENGSTASSSYANASIEDIGKRFMVSMSDIEDTGKIVGVQANFLCKKDVPGNGSFKPRYKISGSTIESSTTIYPSQKSWYDRIEPMRLNPVTNAEWTVADVNGMQIGAERLS